MYAIDFNLDEKWVDRDTHIIFEGVNSCLYLYINDEIVGSSQGSHHQCEFNISKYIREGNNKLTVKRFMKLVKANC